MKLSHNGKAVVGILCLLANVDAFSTFSGIDNGTEPATVPAIRRIAAYGAPQGGPRPKSPLSLACDVAAGDLVLSSFETGQIMVLNAAGTVVKAIGGESGLITPYGVAVDAEGRILVSEIQTGQIKILSPAGILLDQVDLASVSGHPVSPGRITVADDGRVYVVDLEQREILVLAPDHTLIRTLGPFDYPQKAGAVGGGRVLALSARGTTASVYDARGNFVLSFGEHGKSSVEAVSFPTGFAVDALGRVWIADAFQHRLKVFSPDGGFLFNYGRMEEDSGGFFFPVDLCFGPNERLFVLEKGANRVQVFQVEGLGPALEE